jgi:hypothetical protein
MLPNLNKVYLESVGRACFEANARYAENGRAKAGENSILTRRRRDVLNHGLGGDGLVKTNGLFAESVESPGIQQSGSVWETLAPYLKLARHKPERPPEWHRSSDPWNPVD